METIEIEVGTPRGSIKTATIDIQELPEGDFMGWNYRAWIYLAGQTVEFQQASAGCNDVQSYWPFEDHDTYSSPAIISHRTPINSFEDWQNWLKEYVGSLDPRDIFRARREEGI